MNVLLITFSFPPAGGVGVLRALSFAKYFPMEGVRLDVLTARNAPSVGRDASLLAGVPATVTVHRTWTLDLPFAVRKALKRLLSRRGQAAGPGRATNSATKASPAPAGDLLRRLLGNLLLPDPQVGWLPFALPAARRLVRRRKIDAVLITVPPFSSARLVTGLRRAFPHLRIVLDFRDEWLSTTLHLVSFNNNPRAQKIALRTEREAVRDATVVVAVTEAARREIAGRYPEEAPAKFALVPNGFDQEPARLVGHAGTGEGDGPVVLTYIGSVYGSTDPETFVEAVLGLSDELRARLRVRYIGHIETSALRDTLLRLGPTVELRGFLPQAEALRAIADTTYLLLVTHDRINVAAKFYDYLGGGKPILAVVHPEGDVRRLLEKTGAGAWADVADVTAIRHLLEEALSRPGKPIGRDRRPEIIARYHRRPLAARYTELLRGLGDGSAKG